VELGGDGFSSTSANPCPIVCVRVRINVFPGRWWCWKEATRKVPSRSWDTSVQSYPSALSADARRSCLGTCGDRWHAPRGSALRQKVISAFSVWLRVGSRRIAISRSTATCSTSNRSLRSGSTAKEDLFPFVDNKSSAPTAC